MGSRWARRTDSIRCTKARSPCGPTSARQLLDFGEQRVLDLGEHGIDIGVVQVEGGAVDIHLLHELLDGDLSDGLALHQAGETRAQLRAGFADAPVKLFSHFDSSLFWTVLQSCVE